MLYVQMHRLLNGYSVCLGLAADVDFGDGIDALARAELFKGEENEAHWLGKAVGMKRQAAMTPNILGGARDSQDWNAMFSAISAKRATLEVEGSELVLKPTGEGKGYVTLELSFPLDEKSDFTVFFEAKSGDDQLERKILLPRVSVNVETGPVRAFITSKGYIPVSYYIRGAEASESVKMDFRFDNGGEIRFRSMSVHANADALACEFEEGVVLVNPSLKDVTFNLEQLFHGRRGYKRLLVGKPNGEIGEKYIPQLNQAMSMNDGSVIKDTESVKVGQRNSLFLVADKKATSSHGGGNSEACKNVDTFKLRNGKEVSCRWAEVKREKRCVKKSDKGFQVQDLCPTVCGKC